MSAALIERRSVLEARLHDGWHRIQVAEAAGLDVTDWERFWFGLLDEYQDLCRQLAPQPASAISPTAPQPSRNEQQALELTGQQAIRITGA